MNSLQRQGLKASGLDTFMNHPEGNNNSNWQCLEKLLGYSFEDVRWLVKAMTHGSYANEQHGQGLQDNERLEFLGDAVLDLVISEYLMNEFQGQDEGVLTQIRADVVALPSLARLGRTLNIGAWLLLGKGEERSGGREKSSLLADAMEAIFGAIFSDGGYDAARSVILPLFVPLMKQASMDAGQDYKSRLQEVLQAMQRPLPIYRLSDTTGPAHERVYHVDVLLDGSLCGSGKGRTKKGAEQAAAKCALSEVDKSS